MNQALDLAPFWLRLIAGTAAGALTWVVAADYGSMLVSRWVSFSHPAARAGVGAATGYALLGSAVALIGVAGFINTATLWVLLVVALAVRLPHHLRRARSLPGMWTQARAAVVRADLGAKLALVVIACAVLTGLANAALPAVWWDPIAYHLPIVASALEHGSLDFDPQMVQSGFPLLGEAAALPAYAIAGSAGAAMATLGAGLCVALLCWALADGMRPGSGIIAAMLAASAALWAWLAPSFYVDVPFSMFVLAAIVTALRLRVEPGATADPAGGVIGFGALAGGLCGAAAATKYSGLGATLVVLALVVWLAGPHRARTLAGFAGGFALVAAGWYARALLLSGDPLYPFLSSSAGHVPVVRDFALRYVGMTRHWCGGGTSLADLASLPYRLIAQPRNFCGDPGLALRAGVIFALAAAIVIRQARPLVAIAVALTAFWFLTSQQWRFLLPALFLYATIVAAGTYAAGERLRKLGALMLAMLGVFVVGANWIPIARSQASASLVPALAYMSGRQSAADYLDERLETFSAARWLAQLGIAGTQIAALDDVRDYYFPLGTVWLNPYYQQAVVLDWRAPSAERYTALSARGIRYLVVNENPAYLNRTPTGIDWAAFAKDKRVALREVFSANGVFVYDLGGVH